MSYLKDMTNYYFANESSFYTSDEVKQILNSTKKVSKKEFYNKCQPGDIMITFTAKKWTKNRLLKIKSVLMSSLQASPFTSSKVVLDKNTVIGYGLVPGKGFQTYSLPKFIREIPEACLVRVPSAETYQIEKVITFLRKRIGLKYASSQLLQSLWDRTLDRKVLPFFKDKEDLTDEELESFKEPLFCSSIIAIAYQQAGVHLNLSESIFDVWPKDFLTSLNTEKICRF